MLAFVAALFTLMHSTCLMNGCGISALYTTSERADVSIPEKPHLAGAEHRVPASEKTESLFQILNVVLRALTDRLVVVCAFSSNHYIEAQDMLGSVQQFLPKTRIIVYDIGLSAAERANLNTLCNIELRTFNFDKYPLYFKEHLNFGIWKPFIIQQVSTETDLLLYVDTSIRLIQPLNKAIFSLLARFPLQGTHSPTRIAQYTHDNTFKHFGISRESMRGFTTIQAGCLLMYINKEMRQLLDMWVDCAMNKECIYPDGARTKKISGQPCEEKQNFSSVEYNGCHRFDQSALDVILVRLFGSQVFDKIVPGCRLRRYGKEDLDYMEQNCDWTRYFNIQRRPTHDFSHRLKKC